MIPLVVSSIAGIYLCLTTPRLYVAKTSILVEAQRVPTNFVKSLVSIDLSERISTISQQIMSRTNLEKIIKQFNLYSGPEHREMYMEDKVNGLRRRISVNVGRSRRGTNTFSISFKGDDPEKVMRIANTLATYFIDENLKVREEQAIGTSSFLDDELVMMRRKLESVEDALNKYRKEHIGELPEQLDSNLRVLDRVQLSLSEKELALREARSRLTAMDKAIKAAQKSSRATTPSLNGSIDLGGDGDEVSEEATQLETLKQQLALAQTRYTERHPDVIKLKRIIAGLEARLREQADQPVKNQIPKNGRMSNNSQENKKVDLKQLSERELLEGEIRNLEKEVLELQDKIKVYSARVENTPKREQELLSLNRDYGNIQKQYSSLLSRKLEAEIAVNMERKQKGEQFRILDPARLPQKPSEPDLKKFFLMAVAAGLAVGGGIVFLFDFFDSSFKRMDEIESVIGVPVLATLPSLVQPGELKKRRINLLVSTVSLMFTLCLVGCLAVLAFTDVDKVKDLVSRFIPI